jgi:hypothetical protein
LYGPAQTGRACPYEKGTTMQPLTGSVIHETFHAHTLNAVAWEDLSMYAKLTYELMAHTLNIKADLLPVTQTEYLFVYEGNEIVQASCIDGLVDLIDIHISHNETFEVITLRGGRLVRHDWYILYDHLLLDICSSDDKHESEDLATRLNKRYSVT